MAEKVTPIKQTKAGRNGFDPKRAEELVDAVEAEDAVIAEIMAEAKAKCQPHKDQIKDIKKTAADEGFAKKPFGALLAKRKLLRKADNVGAALNDGQKDDFEQMQHALGMLSDLPLGQAALDTNANAS